MIYQNLKKIIMKKAILFFLFIGISYFSKAQLVVSGTPNYGNTLSGPLYTLGIVNTPTPSFPSQFTPDAGTNPYTKLVANGMPTGNPYYYDIIRGLLVHRQLWVFPN
jgi:hypothetical protein